MTMSVYEEVRRRLPSGVKTQLRRILEKANRLAGISEASLTHQGPVPPPQVDLSQAGEVGTLRRLVRPDFPHSLVDVGAHDGVTISNSRRFALDGWDAILIEPHPDLFAKLEDASSDLARVRCLNVACSNTAGFLPLYLGKNDPQNTMSTLCTDENPWFSNVRSGDCVMVSVKTLTEVLDDCQWPRDLSLLMVDAEGMDYEVLLGLDFELHRPRIIVTEEYISNPEKHRSKYRLLLDKGYTFHSMVGSNTIWIANEWVEACLGLNSADAPAIA
jgi:FkbM family methyltransferase